MSEPSTLRVVLPEVVERACDLWRVHAGERTGAVGEDIPVCAGSVPVRLEFGAVRWNGAATGQVTFEVEVPEGRQLSVTVGRMRIRPAQ